MLSIDRRRSLEVAKRVIRAAFNDNQKSLFGLDRRSLPTGHLLGGVVEGTGAMVLNETGAGPVNSTVTGESNGAEVFKGVVAGEPKSAGAVEFDGVVAGEPTSAGAVEFDGVVAGISNRAEVAQAAARVSSLSNGNEASKNRMFQRKTNAKQMIVIMMQKVK